MLAELFGSDLEIMTTFNPSYPLKFERFGDADPKKDPEFMKHVESCYSAGCPVSGEMMAMSSVYSNQLIYKAEEKARWAYSANDPVKEAKAALSLSPYCPEAYNVMAQMGAKTFNEALGKYFKMILEAKFFVISLVNACSSFCCCKKIQTFCLKFAVIC